MEKNGFFEDGFITDTITDTDLINSSTILLENQRFASSYAELMKQEGNQLDARSQYRRTMIQTINIGVGAAILIALIYKQT